MSAPHVLPRSLPRLLLVLAMVASMLAATAGTARAGDDFDDVPDDHLFHDAIGWLVDEGVTLGFPDGTFRPTRDVTRQEYMAFLYRLAGQPTWAGCDGDTFSDVDAGHLFCEEITWGVEMGVTEGYPDDTFRPDRVVTRQEAVAFQYRAVGEPAHDHEATFSDVDDDHLFHSEIAWADGEGITRGHPDGTFRPTDGVTRQEATAFLFRQDAAGHTVLPGQAPIQRFDASPTTATHRPEDGAREDHTVDPADAPEVVIQLAECDNVDEDGAAVVFAVDDSGTDDVADFGTTDATISDVEVDGTAQPDAGAGDPVTVDGGQPLTFTLNGGDAPECVVPVVFADEDGDGLDVADDGTPTEDLGVAGATTFANATGLTAEADHTLEPFGDTHTVVATLLGSDLDGDGAADPLPLDDTVDARVVRYEDQGTRDLDCDLSGGGFAGTTAEELKVAIDDEGRATITYTGPLDPDGGTDGDRRFDCIVVEWQGSDAYAEQGPFEAVVTADWTDADPSPTTLDLEQDRDVRMVDTSHEVTATVTDQFGEPVAGSDVRFEVDRDTGTFFTDTRTTDADGVATYTYDGSPIEAEDTVTATALDDAGDETGASGTVAVTWSAGIVENLDTGEVHATITDAEAVAEADQVLRAEGEFTEEVTIDVAGLTLRGVDATLHEADSVAADGAFLTVAADDVTVEGLATLDDDEDAFPTHVRVTGDGATIADNQLARRFPSDASRANNSGNPLVHVPGNAATVSGNDLDGGPIGVELSGEDSAVAVSDNTIRSARDEGIWIITISASRVTVEGNSVTDHDLDETGAARARLENRPAAVNGTTTETAEEAANVVLADNAGIATVEVAGTVYP